MLERHFSAHNSFKINATRKRWNKYGSCQNGWITFILTYPKRNSDLDGKVTDNLLDEKVEGGETIKDVKKIKKKKQISSLSVETPSSQEFCPPYKFVPYFLNNFNAK